MAEQVTTRRVFRRTDDYTPGTAKVKFLTEDIPLPLAPTACLLKVHALSLNYRDANIANGGNPWPTTPNGMLCNDAACEVIAVGDRVKSLKVGDRCAPVVDSQFLSDRSTGRSWLAADEDGVSGDYLVYDEEILGSLPAYLDWTSAALIPCAGVTAWSALKGVGIGKSILIQGTGGVACFALKLARASGLKIILSSSSDEKLKEMQKRFGEPPILTVNYATNKNWHEEVLRLTDNIGVDLVLENGGSTSLVRSMKCTRRGGIVSQVGYLGKQKAEDLDELVSVVIDRRVVLRGINAGSKYDMEDLCAALEATQIRLDDIIDSVYNFDQAEEAIQYLWEGKQVGKIVLKL